MRARCVVGCCWVALGGMVARGRRSAGVLGVALQTRGRVTSTLLGGLDESRCESISVQYSTADVRGVHVDFSYYLVYCIIVLVTSFLSLFFLFREFLYFFV